VAKGKPVPAFGADASHLDAAGHALRLEHYDDRHFGYLRVTADARKLRIAFIAVPGGGAPAAEADAVTVDLATHTTVNG
jgi:hypothetical protein